MIDESEPRPEVTVASRPGTPYAPLTQRFLQTLPTTGGDASAAGLRPVAVCLHIRVARDGAETIGGNFVGQSGGYAHYGLAELPDPAPAAQALGALVQDDILQEHIAGALADTAAPEDGAAPAWQAVCTPGGLLLVNTAPPGARFSAGASDADRRREIDRVARVTLAPGSSAHAQLESSRLLAALLAFSLYSVALMAALDATEHRHRRAGARTGAARNHITDYAFRITA